MVATSTILIALAATAVIGAGVSAYGMYAQGQAQKAIGEYNAKIAENNAIAQRQQAQAEADRIRSRHIRLQGAQETAASKSGLTLSGSVNDVMYDSSIESEMDALTAIYKGQIGANQNIASASLSRFEGDQAAEMGTVGAGATILGGIAQGGSYWSMSRQKSTGTSPSF